MLMVSRTLGIAIMLAGLTLAAVSAIGPVQASAAPSAPPSAGVDCGSSSAGDGTTVVTDRYGRTCETWIKGGGNNGTSGSTPISASPPSDCPRPPDAPTNLDLDCNGCHWTRWTSIPPSLANDPAAIAAYDQWLADGQTGVLNLTDCYPGDVQTLYYIKTVSPGSNAWIARAGFAFPTITPDTWPGPSTTRPYSQTLVNYGTYLWIDPAAWETPLGADVTSPDGTVTVHAEANAVSATWDMGDGRGSTPDGTITCHGADADVAYHPGIAASPCRYTYRHSSANRDQASADPNDRPDKVTVTITWNITWSCVSGCDASGSTDPVTTTATLDLVVAEVQSVIVG